MKKPVTLLLLSLLSIGLMGCKIEGAQTEAPVESPILAPVSDVDEDKKEAQIVEEAPSEEIVELDTEEFEPVERVLEEIKDIEFPIVEGENHSNYTFELKEGQTVSFHEKDAVAYWDRNLVPEGEITLEDAESGAFTVVHLIQNTYMYSKEYPKTIEEKASDITFFTSDEYANLYKDLWQKLQKEVTTVSTADYKNLIVPKVSITDKLYGETISYIVDFDFNLSSPENETIPMRHKIIMVKKGNRLVAVAYEDLTNTLE